MFGLGVELTAGYTLANQVKAGVRNKQVRAGFILPKNLFS